MARVSPHRHHTPAAADPAPPPRESTQSAACPWARAVPPMRAPALRRAAPSPAARLSAHLRVPLPPLPARASAMASTSGRATAPATSTTLAPRRRARATAAAAIARPTGRPPPTPRSATARAAPDSAAVPLPEPGAVPPREPTPDGTGGGGLLYPPAERSQIKESWDSIMRWSRKTWRDGDKQAAAAAACDKIVVFGGGSFGTAMAVALARQRPDLDVCMLLRDRAVCADVNERHANERYLPGRVLPPNVRATTSAVAAIAGAQYALHAVPVQHSRAFLEGIKDVLPADVPIVSVSKGLEVGTGLMLSELIPDALGRKQPTAFLSGPSFAAEVVDGRPTGLVAASRDKKLVRALQQLFASPSMRVNTSTDVVGVEVCGALKNVLAIAAGIVEGLGLGANAKAALVSQGCAEIRWLAEKMGAKPGTVAGLSGMGDVMLTCYGELSRNRAVGLRLGRGETLGAILASSPQVAEGVATAGVVVGLARRYRVALPVLTAVAQVLDGALSPAEAVSSIMALPQIEER